VDESAVWALSPVAVPQTCAADRLAPGDKRSVATQGVTALLRTRNAAWLETSWRTSRMKEDGLGTVTPEAAGAKSTHSAAVGHRTAGVAMDATNRPVETPIFEEENLELWPHELTMPLPGMVGESRPMKELAWLIRLVAPRLSTVLIEGETGTGKELVARAVHQLSTRSGKPFVVLNCAAIPETLLEAELFGHTRGAFTGAVQSRTGRIEAAHGGTLFLDEIGEMPLALQAKMLRFLESGELQRVGDNETVQVDVRVIAATHEPLQQRADEHAFRLDLYHRLAVFPVSVPALRERMEDVLPLAAYLLGKLGEEMPVKRLSAGAAMKLMEHAWPGNVRELENVVERAVVLATEPSVPVEVLPDALLEANGIRRTRGDGAPLPPDASLFEIVNDFERRVIMERLEHCGGSQTEAAESLHVPLSTLNQKIKRLDIKIRKKSE
jgi:transcriptional regulator with GAF, ATPase, and Fis domain